MCSRAKGYSVHEGAPEVGAERSNMTQYKNQELVEELTNAVSKEAVLRILENAAGVASISEQLYKMDFMSIRRIGRRAARHIVPQKLEEVTTRRGVFYKDNSGFYHYNKDEADFAASLNKEVHGW